MEKQPTHPLRGLLIAQFLGAFNDNAWKMIVIVLAYRTLEGPGGSAAVFGPEHQRIATLAMVVFVLPLILFSLPAGVFADRVSKRSVIVSMKGVELVLMTAAMAVLFVSPAGGSPAYVIIGLMGAQSALFGPAKYGILPEILPHNRLSQGNGLLQLWTFAAIVLGTAMAGLLLDQVGDRTWMAGAVLTVLAAIGLLAALWVPRVGAARAEGGLVDTLSSAGRAIRGEQVLLFTVVGLVLFWAIGSLIGQNVLVYGRIDLRLSDALTGVPMGILAIGIGAGSLLASKLSASKVEYGLIPLGALALAVFILLQGGLAPGLLGTLVMMSAVGMASGLVIVPLQALLQWRSPADRRGAIIALANVFISLGTLTGTLIALGLAYRQISTSGIFIVGGLVALAGTAWALWLLPHAFLRLVAILLTNTFYRLTVLGRIHVPERGPALLVPNHVSLVDSVFILASTDRYVRFVVDESLFEHPLLGRLLRLMRAIPIQSSGGPRAMLKAMREAGKHLDAGEVVCVFPEGEITRTGMLLPFREGLERIVKGRTTPILPVHLDRVWGSIFSQEGGRFVWKIPKRIPYPVTISIGKPLPADTPIPEVRRAIQELGAEAWSQRKYTRRPLHRTFIRTARRRPRALAFADAMRPKVSRFGALVASVAMARALRSAWAGQERVGIMLPSSVAAVMVNLAASLSGRTSVNLNWTAGLSGLESAVRQAGLRTVVTSREFLQKAEVALPEGVTAVWLGEVAGGIGTTQRAVAVLLAALAPAWLIERMCGATRTPSVDDTVAIIFSSGSTGEPKGVCLSHFNIDANVEAVVQVFRLLPDDRILGILPLFHSFGYMATLWLAANHGLGVAFHPNPLDGPAIGDLVSRYRLTFLIATPTFLQVYLRRCDPGQLGSLRVVLVGAERLPERLAAAFENRFGIRPLEGYGATECSPTIAVSVPDFRGPDVFQAGSRRGFLGQAVPGVALRIVDPEALPQSLETLQAGKPGMLLVSGPNVMQGYLGRDDLTSEVIREGWYVTGDIAMVDDDGFVRITDRLSRFSKIGGEMVPHGRVEQALQEAAGIEYQGFAVTSVPDEKKGERLAVLHVVEPDDIPDLLKKVKESGLPNLFIPRAEAFIKVDALPMLGTGKLDLRALKEIANEALGSVS